MVAARTWSSACPLENAAHGLRGTHPSSLPAWAACAIPAHLFDAGPCQARPETPWRSHLGMQMGLDTLGARGGARPPPRPTSAKADKALSPSSENLGTTWLGSCVITRPRKEQPLTVHTAHSPPIHHPGPIPLFLILKAVPEGLLPPGPLDLASFPSVFRLHPPAFAYSSSPPGVALSSWPSPPFRTWREPATSWGRVPLICFSLPSA